jgi:hypothetical protein
LDKHCNAKQTEARQVNFSHAKVHSCAFLLGGTNAELSDIAPSCFVACTICVHFCVARGLRLHSSAVFIFETSTCVHSKVDRPNFIHTTNTHCGIAMDLDI